MSIVSKRVASQLAWVKKWPRFVTAKSVLEVGSGSFETLDQLARMHPDKQFYGVDFKLRPQALVVADNAPGNLKVLQHDVRDLRLLPEDHFDFVFSMALIEHVRQLAMHLLEVHRVLKDRGRYCFMASPLWSSSTGHHYDPNAPDCPIPHYGHLYMTRKELGNFLITHGSKSLKESTQLLRRVYDRQDLSRLSRAQTRQIVERSPLKIESWTEGRDNNYNAALANAVLQNNLYGLDAGDLQISTVHCSLIKAEDGYEPPARWRAWLGRLLPAETG